MTDWTEQVIFQQTLNYANDDHDDEIIIVYWTKITSNKDEWLTTGRTTSYYNDWLQKITMETMIKHNIPQSQQW